MWLGSLFGSSLFWSEEVDDDDKDNEVEAWEEEKNWNKMMMLVQRYNTK